MPRATRIPTGRARPAAGGRPGDLTFRTLSLFDPAAPWLTPVGGSAGDAAIFANQQALPRAWLTHQVEVQPDKDARHRRLHHPALDWRSVAVLAAPLPARQVLPPGPAPDADAITITRYAPETVDIAARSAAAGVLVLADQAFPGWEATVDGQPAPILTVDHALRGVYLPAGAHTVRFTMRRRRSAGAPRSAARGGAFRAVGRLAGVAQGADRA